jgi:hypothetical protein
MSRDSCERCRELTHPFAHQEQFDELWARQPCIVSPHRIRCSGTKPTIRGDYQCIPMRESFEAIDIREVN